jgi:hypothetical protein
MASFNSTSSKLQSAIYSLDGKVLFSHEDMKEGKEVGDVVGKGEMRCLCFGLWHSQERGMDYCFLMGGKGEVMLRKGGVSGNTAVGLQGPEGRDEGKMLPRWWWECR